MDQGQAKGLISDEETDMVQGVLDLKETKAHTIMVPRTQVVSASIDATLGEIIELINHFGHTRIPIHNKSLDQITGLLHAKDLLKLWGQDPTTKISSEFLRKPLFVPESRNAAQVLKDLKEKKTHLAIVTDEYGGTSGIITIEDIVEEVVGEIMDEHDNEEPRLTVLNDGSILVDARLEIKKLENHLGIEFPAGEYESVGGFIIHLLGRIPQTSEKISYDNLKMVIKKADQRKIDKILITAPPLSDPQED